MGPSKPGLARYERYGGATMILLCAIAVMVVGFLVHVVFAQNFPIITQDGINATLAAQIKALADRLDKIEALLQYAMIGISSSIIAHILQIIAGKRRRTPEED